MELLGAAGYSYSLQRSKGGSRVHIPVSRQNVIYSYFKHVQGVAATKKQNPSPLTKLTVLNNLIEGLNKQRDIYQFTNPDPKKEKVMDALINQYSQELHKVVNSTIPTFSNPGTGSAAAGMVLDVVA